MSIDSAYKPIAYVYKSHGLIARNTPDQSPEYTYLDLLNMLERAEESISSRYGFLIINRDPSTFTNGQNYYFTSPVNSLAKLSYNGLAFRYAGLADGTLQRRAANTQGAYTEIYSGLSGAPFQTLSTNCFETSQPYLFIYDSAISIKDLGTGTPQLTGIDAPTTSANMQPYSPLLTLIDNFAASNSYETSGFSGSFSYAGVTTLTAATSQQIVDFAEFTGITNDSGASDAFAGVIGGMLSVLDEAVVDMPVNIVSAASTNLTSSLYTELLVTTATSHGYSAGSFISIYGSSSNLLDGFYQVIAAPTATTFTVAYISAVFLSATGGTTHGGQALPSACVIANPQDVPYPSQFSGWGFYQQVPLARTSFPVGSFVGSVPANVTSTAPAMVGATLALDLSQNNEVNDQDLIVLTMFVSEPANIANIRLQFDIQNSGYTSSYYYKDISPAYYQAGVSESQAAYDTAEQQILADAIGLLTGAANASTTAQLQPGNISTGGGAWLTIYLPRGNFVNVGTAGNPGFTWSSVTGWQLLITTETTGGSDIGVNGLYLQWGSGPSSFGGTGYDYRWTFYDANTGTEGNPSPAQQFSAQFGYLASLAAPFLLSQAAQVTGYYSSDPQTTHLRMYRRGGSYGIWQQFDQVPNITAGAPNTLPFVYKDVTADASLAQAQPLVLDNDPPVTSSLRTPIQTTLAAATTAPGTGIYATFAPQSITVIDSTANFVLNQLVIVGNSYNEEIVAVTTPGVGQFSAVLRLQHNAGEQVVVESIPRVACNLCALAYNQVWLAGDPNNPHYLYYSKPFLPENFGPQNYIPVGSPQYPIVIVVNWRGTLFVATTETWWAIVGGATPRPQPTGSIHGAVSSEGWTQSEAAVWYRSTDGYRQFTGSDGQYMTLPVEFLFTQTPLTPVPLTDPTQDSGDVMCLFNNQVICSYVSLNAGSPRYRLVWDLRYQRYRYDDVAATAMLWEKDTNQLVAALPAPISGQFMIVLDQQPNQDYDDGGWVGSPPLLAKTPINLALQTPFQDLGAPHFPKQWNVLETDVNTAGQVMSTQMLFDTEPPTSLTLATANTGLVRQKVQFQISDGTADADGFEAYSASIRHTMAVTSAPTFYQENIYAAILADYRSSFDTYWIGFGTDESKIIKQAYFDYTTDSPITINLYADGNMAAPYFSFVLPVTTSRWVQRQIFSPGKYRRWRAIGVCDGNYQFWSAVQVEVRPIKEGSTFSKYEVKM